MKEYIDRSALIEIIKEELSFCEDRDSEKTPILYGCELGLRSAKSFVEAMSAADVVEVVRCKDCKRQDTIECPLVMVRFDMSRTGEINEILEQNAVGDDFGCTRGERRSDT